jgi:hypothetical protein
VIAIDMSPPNTSSFALMTPFVAKGLEKTCPAGIFTGRPLPNGKPAPFLRTDHIFYYSPHLRGASEERDHPMRHRSVLRLRSPLRRAEVELP